MTVPDDRRHLLIWDGECGLCARVICWIDRQDVAQRFTAVPFQECARPPMTDQLLAASRLAVQVITRDGQRLSAARAVLFILDEIGWHPWIVAITRRRPLIDLAELGYRFVASHRPRVGRFLFRTPCPDRVT